MDGGSLVLTTRPIGGAYPEYRSLPPDGFEHGPGYANDAPGPQQYEMDADVFRIANVLRGRRSGRHR